MLSFKWMKGLALCYLYQHSTVHGSLCKGLTDNLLPSSLYLMELLPLFWRGGAAVLSTILPDCLVKSQLNSQILQKGIGTPEKRLQASSKEDCLIWAGCVKWKVTIWHAFRKKMCPSLLLSQIPDSHHISADTSTQHKMTASGDKQILTWKLLVIIFHF